MKITDVHARVMAVPGPDGRTVRRNWIFVQVKTDVGITGIGEATTEYHEMAVAAQINTELKPRLLGLDPTNIEAIWQLSFRDFWWRGGVVHTSAISGIDQALWDIAGKTTGQPVFKLLGGKVRDTVRCYARGDLAACTEPEAALQAVDEGFDAFKTAAVAQPFDPHTQLEAEIEAAAQIRKAVGPGIDIMIDAGERYSQQEACKLLAALRPLNVLFVEEPVNHPAIKDYVTLRHHSPDVRLAAGERWMTRWDCRGWFERQAIDVCQVDISHTGGISELMKIAHFAETYGISMAPHNPYGPVALAASAHAAAAMSNFLILEHCRLRPWFDDVQIQRVPLNGGYINVNELAKRPGLGVELDMDLVESHPYQTLEPRHVGTDTDG